MKTEAIMRAMMIGLTLFMVGILLFAFGAIFRSMPGSNRWLMVSGIVGTTTGVAATLRMPLWGGWICGTAASAASTLLLSEVGPHIELVQGLAKAPVDGIIGMWLAWGWRRNAQAPLP